MGQRRRTGGSSGGGAVAWVLRALGAVLRVVGAVAFVAVVVTGSIAGWRWLNGDRRFAVLHIEYSGLHRATEDDLSRRGGLAVGRNIFDVNTVQVSAAMEKADWVAHAKVERAMPDTLRVVVTEWEPVAVVNAAALYVVDKDGVRIKELAAADHLDLPLISGLPPDGLDADRQPASPEVVAALDVMRAWQAGTASKRITLSELHVAEESGEAVYTAFCGDDPAVEVRLGAFASDTAGEMAKVMGRLDRLWTELEHEGRRASSIDLGNRQRPEWVPTRIAGEQLAAKSTEPTKVPHTN